MQTNFVRKITSILMVLVLIISFGACTKKADKGSDTQGSATLDSSLSNEGSQDEVAEKPLYRIPVFALPVHVGELKSSDETDVGKLIKDKFNIVFDFMPYTGNALDKQNLMLAAGDYPEILQLEGEDIFQKYLKADSLICLDDYLDNMPGFKSLFNTQIPYWRLSSDEGKLYKWEGSLPQDPKVLTLVYGVMVRSDVLEKQGYPKVLSTSDYVSFIKQGLKDFPETNGKKTIGMSVPFAESWGLIGIGPVMFEKGETYPVGTGRTVLYNAKKDIFEPLLETQEVKDSFHFFNTLYREGLLDPECFTDKSDQITAKTKAARSIAVWYSTWLTQEANSDFTQRGEDKYRYVHLPVQSDSQVANNEKYILPVETTRAFSSRVITKNAKQPERIIELLEWSASEEGQRILQSGVPGKHFTIEDGIPKITQELVDNYQNVDYMKLSGIATISEFLVNALGVDSKGIPFSIFAVPDERIAQHERDKEVYNALGYIDFKDMMLNIGKRWESGLVSSIAIGSDTELNKVNAMIQDYMTKNLSKVILNPKNDEEFDKEWEKFLDGYKKFEPQKIVDECNRQYTEKKALLEEMKKR